MSEANEPEIHNALHRLYHRLHAFIVDAVARSDTNTTIDPVTAAWGLMGLGTMMTIMNELELTNSREREILFKQISRLLIQTK